MNTAIPETVSEKKQRGRPRLLDHENRLRLKRVAVEATTDRTLQNAHYREKALYFVLNLQETYPELRWLADKAAIMASKGSPRDRWKPTILAELGRIVPNDVLIDVARELCELKPRTHEAVRRIRAFRMLTANGTRALEAAK